VGVAVIGQPVTASGALSSYRVMWLISAAALAGVSVVFLLAYPSRGAGEVAARADALAWAEARDGAAARAETQRNAPLAARPVPEVGDAGPAGVRGARRRPR
jgi:hypothetical protein